MTSIGYVALGQPTLSRCVVHLAGMSAANDVGEVFGHAHGLVTGEMLDFQFEVLWQKLTEEDALIHEARSQHALAKIGGQVERACHHSSALLLGIAAGSVLGAAAAIASLTSIKQCRSALPLSMANRTATRNLPSELQPLRQ